MTDREIPPDKDPLLKFSSSGFAQLNRNGDAPHTIQPVAANEVEAFSQPDIHATSELPLDVVDLGVIRTETERNNPDGHRRWQRPTQPGKRLQLLGKQAVAGAAAGL